MPGVVPVLVTAAVPVTMVPEGMVTVVPLTTALLLVEVIVPDEIVRFP